MQPIYFGHLLLNKQERMWSFFRDFLINLVTRIPGLFIFLGFVSCGASRFCFDKGSHFPSKETTWFFVWLGVAFILAGLVILFLQTQKVHKSLRNNTSCKFNSTTVTIVIGNIQNVTNISKSGAFVLPANTTFADKCVEDPNSALGAFFKEHHPDKISDFPQRIKEILAGRKIVPSDSGHYEPAMAVLLPEEYSMPAKVILVSSSILEKGKGFHSEPALVAASIQNVFKELADKKINTIYFPVIGSGHAGLELTDSLCLLMLSIKFLSRQFHYAKNVYIFVREVDRKKINASFLNSL